MGDTQSVVVFIPCYNCAAFVPGVLRALPPATIERVDQVLVVDNCSRDATVQAAVSEARLLPQGKVTVVQNAQNYGLGGSHKVAIDYARKHRFKYVATLHGDGQADATELDHLLDALKVNPTADAVLGCRFMPGTKIQGYSRLRILGNRGLNLVFSIVYLQHIYDLGSGLNIFSVQAPLDFENFANDCTFNHDLLLALLQAKRKIVQVPISWSEAGQLSNIKTIPFGFRTLGKLWRWKVHGRPQRLTALSEPRSYTVHYP